MNLYQKLAEVQRRVSALSPNAKGYDYQYISGSKLLYFVKPIMNEVGLILKQEVVSVNNTRIDYAVKNGSKSEMFTEVEMLFTWIDTESGEVMECRWFANGMNAWDKGLGSALTYGERYFLLKFFHIATDEDDVDVPKARDGQQQSPAVQLDQMPQSKPTLSEVQVNDERLYQWIRKHYDTLDDYGKVDFRVVEYLRTKYELPDDFVERIRSGWDVYRHQFD